tara:strand:+ start:129 stop:440 length:312 start_codon:yes stop_codon:yes gene_type:complete
MSRPVVTDSADEKQIKASEDYEDGLVKGLETLLNNRQSRGWLFDRLSLLCHLDGSSHVPGCSDSTAFNEGARSVGVAIIREIRDTYPNQYMKMLEESLFDTKP